MRKCYSIKENFYNVRTVNDILFNNKLLDDEKQMLLPDANDDANDHGSDKLYLKGRNY